MTDKHTEARTTGNELLTENTDIDLCLQTVTSAGMVTSTLTTSGIHISREDKSVCVEWNTCTLDRRVGHVRASTVYMTSDDVGFSLHHRHHVTRTQAAECCTVEGQTRRRDGGFWTDRNILSGRVYF